MTGRVTVSPGKVAVGDPIAVRLVVDCPPAARLVLTNPASTPGLERLAVTPWRYRESGGQWRLERTERWASFSPGTTSALRYSLRGSPGGSVEIVSGPIETVSVLPPGPSTPAPSPLAGPVAKTFVPWEWPAAALLAILVAALFVRFLRRRNPERYAPKSPDELFEQELLLLEEKLARGEPDGEFFDWLAETTRWYLEQKLSIPAPRETSSEILRELGARGATMPAGDVAAIFAACDGYRFARRRTRTEQASEAIAAARRAAAEIRRALEPPSEMSA